MILQNFFRSAALIALPSLLAFSAYAAGTPAPSAKRPAKRVDVSQDVDTLGGNENLQQMVQALDPENRARIVQSRTVDRYNRLELGLSYGGVAGGDPYLRTQSLGLAGDFHLSPHWSVGARYNDYGNDLTPEGQRVLSNYRNNQAAQAQGTTFDIDSPHRSAAAVVSWYPVYGKINMFDSGIAQFDIYLLAGGGQIELDKEGWTTMYTAGGGVGFWINNHVTTRLELRWQNYKDSAFDGTQNVSRNVNGAIGSVGLGFLL